jgi:toxin ParE1/3/4
MAYRLVTTREAMADLLDIAAFIAADSPKRARSFVAELKLRMENSLTSFPNTGRSYGDVRVLSLSNYIAVYRVDDVTKTVTVILVTEGHRDWQELLEDRI